MHFWEREEKKHIKLPLVSPCGVLSSHPTHLLCWGKLSQFKQESAAPAEHKLSSGGCWKPRWGWLRPLRLLVHLGPQLHWVEKLYDFKVLALLVLHWYDIWSYILCYITVGELSNMLIHFLKRASFSVEGEWEEQHWLYFCCGGFR